MEKIRQCLMTVFAPFLLVVFLLSTVYAATDDPDWTPWYAKRQNLTREQFVRAIETNDRTLLRVDAREFARVWGLEDLPVTEDLVQVARFLRGDEVQDVPCTPALLKKVTLGAVNVRTGATRFTLHREACYAGERLLLWRGVPFVSLGCGNPGRAREPRLTPLPLPPVPSLPPVGIVPPRQETRCVPLDPFYHGKIIFPTVEDRGKWLDCNQWADCVEDCIPWVKGDVFVRKYYGHKSSGRMRILPSGSSSDAKVRVLTGQGARGGHAALRGATHIPIREDRTGPAAVCDPVTGRWWVIWHDGREPTAGLPSS